MELLASIPQPYCNNEWYNKIMGLLSYLLVSLSQIHWERRTSDNEFFHTSNEFVCKYQFTQEILSSFFFFNTGRVSLQKLWRIEKSTPLSSRFFFGKQQFIHLTTPDTLMLSVLINAGLCTMSLSKCFSNVTTEIQI